MSITAIAVDLDQTVGMGWHGDADQRIGRLAISNRRHAGALDQRQVLAPLVAKG